MLPSDPRRLQGAAFFRPGLEIFVNRNRESFDYQMHAHDFVEIAYVTEGRGFHHLGDRTEAVSKGDLFVLPIGTSHVFRPVGAGGERLVVYNCLFTERMLQAAAALVPDFDLIDALRLRSSEAFGAYDPDLSVEPLFAAMLDEHAAMRPGSSAMLFAMLVRLLLLLVRLLERPHRPAFEAADPIGQAVAYMRRHASEKLTVAELARLSRMSERHFFRRFKQRTGQTFHDFLQQERIQAACQLLAHTDCKITTVAEQVGYRDLPSFHRLFKRTVGLTPGAYRKRLQAPAPRS